MLAGALRLFCRVAASFHEALQVTPNPPSRRGFPRATHSGTPNESGLGFLKFAETPPLEYISVIAALVSAVGIVLSACASYRSAESAKRTEDASLEAERRAFLRQISLTSVDVVTEAERVKSRGEATKVAYNDLAAFTGNVGSSRLNMFKIKLTIKSKLLRKWPSTPDP